jgi:nitrate reductase cytochrome c-type subunit
MQQTLRTKLLIGILAALTVIGGVLAHELQVSKETATSTAKTAAEREKAEQIDRDDKAAIQKIRERNAQKATTAPNQ